MNQLGKVFLSHKSEDKDFVRYVAEKSGSIGVIMTSTHLKTE